jgi:hypothetical protein
MISSNFWPFLNMPAAKTPLIKLNPGLRLRLYPGPILGVVAIYNMAKHRHGTSEHRITRAGWI